MTDFEQLLLAKGDADLICSFVIDYTEILSDDFKSVFASYIEEAKKRLAAKEKMALSNLKDSSKQHLRTAQIAKPDLVGKQMSITDLLKYHEGDDHIKTRILTSTRWNDVYTVGDLLEEGRHSLSQMRMMGKTSMAVLEECLGKIGYRLSDH